MFFGGDNTFKGKNAQRAMANGFANEFSLFNLFLLLVIIFTYYYEQLNFYSRVWWNWLLDEFLIVFDYNWGVNLYLFNYILIVVS